MSIGDCPKWPECGHKVMGQCTEDEDMSENQQGYVPAGRNEGFVGFFDGEGVTERRDRLFENWIVSSGLTSLPIGTKLYAKQAHASRDTEVQILRQDLAESAAEIAALKAQKDGAYLERNRCVALIAQMAIALGLKAGKARTAIEGWSDDWHGCIYIDLPAGQVSWHYHDSQAFLFDALPTYEGKWDGHDTAEKYRRVGLPFESALRTQLEEARKDAMNEGIGKAAAWVDARREAFMLANGHEDPSTGTWEYGSGPHAQAKLDYDSELAEIADGLRELKAPRFSRVSCSQCGQLFGPRDFGYSRCIDHAGRAAIDAAKEQGK